MILPILRQSSLGIPIIALRSHLRLTAIVMSASLCAGLIYYFWGPRAYRSYARVEFTDSHHAMVPAGLSQDTRHEKLIEQLTAPHIIERTARKLGLKGSAREIQLAYVYKTIIRKKEPHFFLVEVWSATPDLARNWTAALISEILADAEEQRSREREEIVTVSAREAQAVLAELADNLTQRFASKNRDRLLDELGEIRAAASEWLSVDKTADKLERVLGLLASSSLDPITELSILAAPKGDEDDRAGALQERRMDIISFPSTGETELTKLDSGLLADLRVRGDRIRAHMTQRIAALELASDDNALSVSVSAIRNVSPERRSPNWKQVAMVSFLVGMLFAVGVPLLIEFVNPALTNIAEAESLLSLRALGSIPQLGPDEIADAFVEVKGVEANPLLESAHLIRANLPFPTSAATTPRVVMVTGVLARAGKTTTSAALARSFAEAGWKTLLLDLDFHEAGVHRVFGYRRSPGLTDHLLGERSLEEACRPTKIPGLTLLNAGQCLADGIGDFTTGTFAELTQTLRTKFDRIVIDTPAVSSLAAWIDQKHIDAVVFVASSGRISRRQIRNAIEALSLNGVTLSGFVLNRVSVVDSSLRREESPGRKIETRNRDYRWWRTPRHVAAGYHS